MIFWAFDGRHPELPQHITGPLFYDCGWGNGAAARTATGRLSFQVAPVQTDTAIRHPLKFVYPVALRHFVKNPNYAVEHGVARLGWLRPDVLHAVRTGQAVLLLEDVYEGFPDRDKLHATFFAELCTAFNLPPKRVIWWTGNSIAQRLIPEDSVTVVTEDCQFWQLVIEHYIGDKARIDALQHSTVKPSRFLCYNRHWNETRQYFVLDLLERGLLGRGLVSLSTAPDQDTAAHFCNPEAFSTWELTEDARLAKAQLAPQLLARLPLVLDADLGPNLAHTFVHEHYLQTDLSVINETWSDPTTMFISEKTFKTILMRHPFLVLSSPGFLSYVRSLGFQTFAPYLNEDYDNERRLAKRKATLLNELQRWVRLTDQQRSSALTAMAEITEFNFKHLLTKRRPGERLYPVLKELL